MSGLVLIFVSGSFTARHNDLSFGGEPHEHEWHVTAWFRVPPGTDARCQRAALRSLLKLWESKLLPDNLAWGEDIAAAVGTLANCVRVVVNRPDEGIGAEWPAQ